MDAPEPLTVEERLAVQHAAQLEAWYASGVLVAMLVLFVLAKALGA